MPENCTISMALNIALLGFLVKIIVLRAHDLIV